MSGDVVARARELLSPPPCDECGADHSRIMHVEIRDMLAELVPELVAEVEKLRGALETIRGIGMGNRHHHAFRRVLGLIERLDEEVR